jgi:translation initiation factor 2-alpha kinase 3
MMQPTSDIFDRSNLISLNRRKRLAEYDKTVDDDSFIVFEASNKDLKSESGAESKIDSEVTDASSHRIEEQETIISDELGLMYLYIQQELCHKRTLQHWLKIEKCRNKLQVMKFFAEIVDAVEYVHSKKLIHRDLKPGNIFLSGNHDGNDDINVKIGDFGLVTSALVPLESPDPDGSSGDSEKTAESPGTYRKSKVHFTGNVGTYLYMSPEQSRRRPYDYKVDIYSLGLIFYELLVPFSTDMERYDVLTKVKSLQFPSDFEKKFSEEVSVSTVNFHLFQYTSFLTLNFPDFLPRNS